MSDLEHNKELIVQAGNKEAIELWHAVTLQTIRNKSYDLSARQMAILLTVYSDVSAQHTVKNLAEKLNITKPPICRALDTLSKYNLVQRSVDKNDRRIIYVEPTDSGYQYLADFSENIMDKLVML